MRENTVADDGLGSVLRYHDNLVEAQYSFAKMDKGSLNDELARMQKTSQGGDKLKELPGAVQKAEARIQDLQTELAKRAGAEGPRDVFPMVLGFKRDGLDLRRSSDVAGEVRSHSGGISREKNLQYAMAPKSRLPELRRFLDEKLGPDHGVELLPSEALHQVKQAHPQMHHSFVAPGDGVGAGTGSYLDEAHSILK